MRSTVSRSPRELRANTGYKTMHTSHSHGHVTVHVPFLESFARFHSGTSWSSYLAGAGRVASRIIQCD